LDTANQEIDNDHPLLLVTHTELLAPVVRPANKVYGRKAITLRSHLWLKGEVQNILKYSVKLIKEGKKKGILWFCNHQMPP
jgi:hypothetical protein